MSDNYFEPAWTEKLKLPVKRVGDRWEFFYGGDVPVRDATLAELIVAANSITDERFKERVTRELTVKILDEGTPLLVALSDRSGAQLGDWPEYHPYQLPAGTSRLERITLGPLKKKSGQHGELFPTSGGLWLKLKGVERCELVASTVRMPVGLGQDITASSLNHAFTLLSEKYEQHRISHTGNVYERIFYQDKTGYWYPLNDLRLGVQAEAERRLVNDAWAEVERVLGWRPAVAPKKRTK